MSENSYLQVLHSLFLPENLVTSKPLVTVFRNLVHEFRSYRRAELKKNKKKMSENLYLQVLNNLFPSKTLLTSQLWGEAF